MVMVCIEEINGNEEMVDQINSPLVIHAAKRGPGHTPGVSSNRHNHLAPGTRTTGSTVEQVKQIPVSGQSQTSEIGH